MRRLFKEVFKIYCNGCDLAYKEDLIFWVIMTNDDFVLELHYKDLTRVTENLFHFFMFNEIKVYQTGDVIG